MKEKDFNLLEEPWIRVLMPDCTVREVSLTDALLHAQEYADLAGELPTQDVAVLRLLLAVLQTVFSQVDVEGQPAPFDSTDDALLRWKSLWQLGHFPQKPVCSYLEKWRERFWLFHPERPFWQVPEAKIGTEYNASKLNGEMSESSNKLRLFAAYSGTGKAEMTYAQAARWLLYINGYDDTSAKPKGKNLPSVGAGWLGRLGLIMAQGQNLFETLMLNFVFLKDGESLWGEQRPCWELEKARSGERTEIAQPDNAAQLLTLQSRRLLLHRENDGRVTGYSLLGGDFFDKENAFCEQMTVWRSGQAKKNTPVTFQPFRHDPSKQFWREFPSVFTQQPNTRQPGIVRWLTRLQTDGLLDRKKMMQFRVTAVQYGDKDFFVTDTFSDSLSFHALLLDELGKMWRNKITEEIGRCEKLAVCLYDLAKDLAVAAGGDSKTVSNAAAQQFYFQIDKPFRDWLYTIDPDWDDEKSEQNVRDWQAKAKQIARRLGEQLVLSAGNAAFIGRSITKESEKQKSGKEIHYSAPEAYNHFLFQIQKIYAE